MMAIEICARIPDIVSYVPKISHFVCEFDLMLELFCRDQRIFIQALSDCNP